MFSVFSMIIVFEVFAITEAFFSEYRSTKSIFLSDMRNMKLDISTNYSLGFLITANITRYLTIDDINKTKKKLEKICNLYFLLFFLESS